MKGLIKPFIPKLIPMDTCRNKLPWSHEKNYDLQIRLLILLATCSPIFNPTSLS